MKGKEKIIREQTTTTKKKKRVKMFAKQKGVQLKVSDFDWRKSSVTREWITEQFR